jgi:glycerol uptake facilitator-like aquaporin
MYSRPQKLIAEFIGTFTLVFISAGVICADQFVRIGGPGGLGLAGIALAQGLAYAILITALAHISGGHLNPAVTVGFWVTRKLSTFETLSYWIVQLAGAASAAYLLRFLMPEDVWRLGHAAARARLHTRRGHDHRGSSDVLSRFGVFRYGG